MPKITTVKETPDVVFVLRFDMRGYHSKLLGVYNLSSEAKYAAVKDALKRWPQVKCSIDWSGSSLNGWDHWIGSIGGADYYVVSARLVGTDIND